MRQDQRWTYRKGGKPFTAKRLAGGLAAWGAAAAVALGVASGCGTDGYDPSAGEGAATKSTIATDPVSATTPIASMTPFTKYVSNSVNNMISSCRMFSELKGTDHYRLESIDITNVSSSELKSTTKLSIGEKAKDGTDKTSGELTVNYDTKTIAVQSVFRRNNEPPFVLQVNVPWSPQFEIKGNINLNGNLKNVLGWAGLGDWAIDFIPYLPEIATFQFTSQNSYLRRVEVPAAFIVQQKNKYISSKNMLSEFEARFYNAYMNHPVIAAARPAGGAFHCLQKFKSHLSGGQLIAQIYASSVGSSLKFNAPGAKILFPTSCEEHPKGFNPRFSIYMPVTYDNRIASKQRYNYYRSDSPKRSRYWRQPDWLWGLSCGHNFVVQEEVPMGKCFPTASSTLLADYKCIRMSYGANFLSSYDQETQCFAQACREIRQASLPKANHGFSTLNDGIIDYQVDLSGFMR